MAGYIIDITTKQVEYERMERDNASNRNDNSKKVADWFQQMEQNNSIVNCTKLNCKFNKKHCPIIKELEKAQENNLNKNLIEEMADCNRSECSLTEEIKDIYSNLSLNVFK